MKLDLTEGERAYLTEMRGLTTDLQGNEILVGLTVEESIWYMEHNRQWLAEHMDDSIPNKSREGRQRHRELHEKYQRARFQVLGAEHVLRTENPTRN